MGIPYSKPPGEPRSALLGGDGPLSLSTPEHVNLPFAQGIVWHSRPGHIPIPYDPHPSPPLPQPKSFPCSEGPGM